MGEACWMARQKRISVSSLPKRMAWMMSLRGLSGWRRNGKAELLKHAACQRRAAHGLGHHVRGEEKALVKRLIPAA
jgi:hypothetical protein